MKEKYISYSNGLAEKLITEQGYQYKGRDADGSVHLVKKYPNGHAHYRTVFDLDFDN